MLYYYTESAAPVQGLHLQAEEKIVFLSAIVICAQMCGWMDGSDLSRTVFGLPRRIKMVILNSNPTPVRL